MIQIPVTLKNLTRAVLPIVARRAIREKRVFGSLIEVVHPNTASFFATHNAVHMGIKHQASSIKHQASSIKHQASSIKHQASKSGNG
jgi:predicted translin family RNA/ssDNA-binding protein